MAGNVAMTLPLGVLEHRLKVHQWLQGIGTGLLKVGQWLHNPVTNGGENFWSDKGQEVMSGAVGGGVMAPVAGALGRIISPNASKTLILNSCKRRCKPDSRSSLGRRLELCRTETFIPSGCWQHD